MTRPERAAALVRSATALAILAGLSLPAAAQDITQTAGAFLFSVRGLNFAFQPPGARALGLGGAFVAVANDATAAEANPAGLRLLTRPEISASFGAIKQERVVFAGDVNRNLEPGDHINDPAVLVTSTTTGFSYASIVSPPLLNDSLVVSGYYNVAGSFKTFDDIEVVNMNPALSIQNSRVQLTANLQFELRHVGVGAALKVLDGLEVGASLRRSTLTVQSDWRLFERANEGGGEIVTGVADGTPTDWTFNAGILLTPRPWFTLGFVYKDNGSYELLERQQYDCFADEFGDAICGGGIGGAYIARRDFVDALNIPTFIGLGIALRPSTRLTISADADRISYSMLETRERSFPVRYFLHDPDPDLDFAEPIEDAWEVHVGAEYRLSLGQSRSPLFLRAGLWTDPDHDGLRQITEDDTGQVVGPEDATQTHYAFGFGGAFGGWGLDAAAHFSRTVKYEFNLTAVKRF